MAGCPVVPMNDDPMIPARGYGMLTFTRKNRLAAFVGPPVVVRETLASLDRIHALMLCATLVEVASQSNQYQRLVKPEVFNGKGKRLFPWTAQPDMIECGRALKFPAKGLVPPADTASLKNCAAFHSFLRIPAAGILL